MPIILNFNSCAQSATLDLTEADASLKSSLERISSGKKIDRSGEDACGLSLDYKIKSESSRSLATIRNLRNAQSYFQLKDSSLGAVGQIFERMAMLRMKSRGITRNSRDIENYSKEFRELQLQIDQIKNLRFNGMSLFASHDAEPYNARVTGIGPFQRADGSVIFYHKCGSLVHINLSKAETTVSINVFNLQFFAFYKALGMSKVNLVELDGQFYANKITEIAIILFTYALAKIAHARAMNEAEQNRLDHTLRSLESFYLNMEAVHGRNDGGLYCNRINLLCRKQDARSIKCQHGRPSQSVVEPSTHSVQMNQQMPKSFSRLQPFGVIKRAQTKTFHKAKDDMSEIWSSLNNLFSIQNLVTARMSTPFNIN